MRIEVENDAVRARKKQEYEDLVSKMQSQGYEPRLEKISIVVANLFALVILAVVGSISFLIHVMVNGKANFFHDAILDNFSAQLWTWILLLVYIVTIFVHEFIHGFFWHFPCQKKWGSIEFGFNAKMLTPYCHCREALSIPQYFWGCIAPTVILGILPIIIGIVISSFGLILLGVIGVCGGGGDIMVVWTLRKHRDCKLFDHPYEVGYAYFVRVSHE